MFFSIYSDFLTTFIYKQNIQASKTIKDPHRSPRINEIEGAKPGVYWANLTYFDGIFSAVWLALIITPLPGPSTVSMGGRGHRAGGKGGTLSGGRGQGHRGQMSLITLWSGRE